MSVLMIIFMTSYTFRVSPLKITTIQQAYFYVCAK